MGSSHSAILRPQVRAPQKLRKNATVLEVVRAFFAAGTSTRHIGGTDGSGSSM